MPYAARDSAGRWLAVVVFIAAAKHLKARNQWIGCTRRALPDDHKRAINPRCERTSTTPWLRPPRSFPPSTSEPHRSSNDREEPGSA
jgi:hypothetical protein